MSNQLKTLAATCILAFTGASQAAGTWETTLLGRDMNGKAVDGSSASAVFLYDTDLKITWLRDANQNGNWDWVTAKSWASGLTVGAYGGWRLPLSDTSCITYDCTASEMGHLWYEELGNPARGPMTNAGNFRNLQSAGYWSSSDYSTRYAWHFSTSDGYQGPFLKTYAQYALAVRPGDVLAAVPEPETFALMLSGLGVLGFVARRRKGTPA